MTTTTLVDSMSAPGSTREVQQVISSGATGDPIIIGGKDCSVVCAPAAGGSGKLQLSFSPIAQIQAGGGVWFDWSLGTVSSPAFNTGQGCSAIRGISLAGVLTVEVLVR